MNAASALNEAESRKAELERQRDERWKTALEFDELLKPREVAKILRIHFRTVYRLLEEGTIPAFKTAGVRGCWRISRRRLNDWLRQVSGSV